MKTKTTIGNESSKDLSAHSAWNADGEIWVWGPQESAGGITQWGVNEGRYGSSYSVRMFYSRTEASREVRKLRRERTEWAAMKAESKPD